MADVEDEDARRAAFVELLAGLSSEPATPDSTPVPTEIVDDLAALAEGRLVMEGVEIDPAWQLRGILHEQLGQAGDTAEPPVEPPAETPRMPAPNRAQGTSSTAALHGPEPADLLGYAIRDAVTRSDGSGNWRPL